MRRKVAESIHGSGKIYRFIERNRLGEKIAVHVCRAKADVGVGRGNNPKYWLSITTLVTDRWGNVQEKYNPQIKIMDGQRIINKAWILEPNAENVQRLLEQVERLAFGGQ